MERYCSIPAAIHTTDCGLVYNKYSSFNEFYQPPNSVKKIEPDTTGLDNEEKFQLHGIWNSRIRALDMAAVRIMIPPINK